MTGEQFGGLLRTVLAFAAGYVPPAFMNADQTAAVVGGLVALGIAVWSYVTKKPAA